MSAARWAEVSTLTFTVALFGYIAAMLVAFAYLAFRRRPLSTASRAIAVAAAGANLVSIVARGIAAGRTPWGNMYEFSALLALLVVVGYLVLVELRMSVRTLGGFVYAFAVFTLAIAALFFDVGPGPLQPALDSYWRNIHVTSMIAASSLLGIGCVVSILFLVQDRRERRELARIRGDGPPPIMGASVDADAPPDYAVGADEPAGPDPSAIPAVRRGVLPSAATLDRIAYRMIAFGFPVWTFGVICGAIWAQEAWGRYWGWDPKETWSFITWTIFAGYLHARATSGWRGTRAAVIALVGFVSLLVTYYAVNLWIAGLHSYAR